MAAGVFNIARGKIAYYASLPAANDALIVSLFKVAGQVADSAMRDYTTLAAVKAANTEADFTNYARKVITTGIVSPGQGSITPDNTLDQLAIDMADLAWAAAGGTTNNSLGRLVISYQPDTTVSNDALQVPLTFYDYVTTTDGTTRNVVINTGGFWRSQ